MKAPVGAVVKIAYDSTEDLAPGDTLRTDTGRCYVILAGRRQQRGKHRGRYHLTCSVQEIPPKDGRVFPLYWHSRDAKKGAGERSPLDLTAPRQPARAR